MTEAVEKDLGELEAKSIGNGKVYGFEGAELRTYVEARLKEVKDRKERQSSEDRSKLVETIRKLEDKVAEVQSRTQRSDVCSVNGEQNESSRSSPGRIKLPKHDGKQTVVHYLELFEEIAERNSFRVEEWLLRVRVAVAGTKLEKCCSRCHTYSDAKREIAFFSLLLTLLSYRIFHEKRFFWVCSSLLSLFFEQSAFPDTLPSFPTLFIACNFFLHSLALLALWWESNVADC